MIPETNNKENQAVSRETLPLGGASCSPSFILAAKWREKADHCEAEIARSKGEKPTLHLSVEWRIRYEQAARTLRQCADEIHSLENSQLNKQKLDS